MSTIEDYAENQREETVPDREGFILLGLTLLLGFAAELLFFEKPMGVSVPIFALLFYMIFLRTLHRQIRLEFSFGWLLSIPVALLSASYLIFSNELFQGLNLLAVPVLIVAQTTLLAGRNEHAWYSPGFVFDLILGLAARTWMRMNRAWQLVWKHVRPRSEPKKYENLGKVVLALLLSLPLLLVILILLSSADQVFANLVVKIPQTLELLPMDELIGRSFMVLLVALAGFSYLMSLMTGRKTIVAAEVKSTEDHRFWDPVMVITVFFLVNLVYLFFDLIQFTYLFASVDFDLPAGFTYAEYARRGFFELVIVTLINLTLLLLSMNLTKKAGRAIDTCLKVLQTLLVLCTFVMLVSAHLRMSLYEEVYGYTYLRVLTHGFMILIFALLLSALLKIWVEKIPLVRVYITVGLAAYLIVNFMNLDRVIAEKNLDRYSHTGKIDIAYLEGLSWDAVPVLARLLEETNPGIAGEMKNYLGMKKTELSGEQPWQSWNLAKHRAEKVLAKYSLPETTADSYSSEANRSPAETQSRENSRN